MFNYVFVTFPCGILGHVWYLIVPIPDLCHLSYYYLVYADIPDSTHSQATISMTYRWLDVDGPLLYSMWDVVKFYDISGAGQMNSNGASGASHGSRGGRGQSYIEAVDPYGTIYVESTWGSGGGSYVTYGNNGGRGGGYVHLYVRDTVIISGQISANGKNSGVSL